MSAHVWVTVHEREGRRFVEVGRCKHCGARSTWALARRPCPIATIEGEAAVSSEAREASAASSRARARALWLRRRQARGEGAAM